MIAFENGTKELTRTTEKKRDRRRTVKYVPTARISENFATYACTFKTCRRSIYPNGAWSMVHRINDNLNRTRRHYIKYNTQMIYICI